MLVKGGHVVEDRFINIADGEALPEGAIVVSAKRFLSENDALLAREAPLGVQLETGDSRLAFSGSVGLRALPPRANSHIDAS